MKRQLSASLLWDLELQLECNEPSSRERGAAQKLACYTAALAETSVKILIAIISTHLIPSLFHLLVPASRIFESTTADLGIGFFFFFFKMQQPY